MPMHRRTGLHQRTAVIADAGNGTSDLVRGKAVALFGGPGRKSQHRHGAAEDAQQQIDLIRSFKILSNAFQESTTFRSQIHTGFAAAAGNTNPVYPIIHSLPTVCNPPGVTALQNPHGCLTKQTGTIYNEGAAKRMQSACRAKKMAAGRWPGVPGKGGPVPHWAADMPGGNGNGTRYARRLLACALCALAFALTALPTAAFAQQPEEQAAVQQSLSATDVRGDAAGRCRRHRPDRQQRLRRTDDRGRAHRCCFGSSWMR